MHESLRQAMRITVLIPDLALDGGVTNYFRTLNLDAESNIDYFYVNKPYTKSRLSKAFHACGIFVKFVFVVRGSQLVHVNPSLNFNSFWRDMVFIFLSRILRKKVLVFFRGWDNEFQHAIEKSRLASALFRSTYARADRFVVLSRDFQARLVSLGVSPDKPFHLETTVADSSGLDGFKIEHKIQSAGTHMTCLFMSRVLRSKGIFIAIDAFVACRAKVDRPMTLHVAGEGPDLDAAKAYVSSGDLTGIEFHGEVRGAEKMKLLTTCHVMIFPTYYGEGLPNCVLEGMLYGMPIISRINAGIPDVVQHGVNGYLSESVESDVFTGFLHSLIEDEQRYSDIAHENYDKARVAFSTENVRSRLLDLYGQMA